MKQKTCLIALIIGLNLISGCTVVHTIEPETGHYYVNPKGNINNIGKVVLLELENDATHRDISMNITEAIRENLQKKHLFSVRTLDSSDPEWAMLELDHARSYSLKEMAVIRRKLGADAIIYGTITQYYPYPHMLIGLHLKMIDLKEGKLVWAMEQVWDSRDKQVEYRMRAFYQNNLRKGYEPMDWTLLYTSPRAFNKFISHEIAITMPESNGYGRYLSSGKSKYNGQNETILDHTKKIPSETLKFSEEVTTIRL